MRIGLVFSQYFVVVFLMIFCFACTNSNTTFELAKSSDPEKFVYQGARVKPPYPKPNVVLTTSKGEKFDFREQTAGLLTLLYFGYTSCPDICPLHMFEIDRVLSNLSNEAVKNIQVVFVTTDPERDTPEKLASYSSASNYTWDFLTVNSSFPENQELKSQFLFPDIEYVCVEWF